MADQEMTPLDKEMVEDLVGAPKNKDNPWKEDTSIEPKKVSKEKKINVDDEDITMGKTTIEINDLKGVSITSDSRFLNINGIMIPFAQDPSGLPLKFDNEHDRPPPPGLGNVSGDHAMNEYILNHTPLLEDQKKWLIKVSMKDQAADEREKRDKLVKEELKNHKPKKIGFKRRTRVGVKTKPLL